MGLDSLDDIEIGNSGGEKASESAKEAQEKKEKSAKGMAGIQRTRKDEKKAAKDNDFLYSIIVDLLKNKDFDILIPLLIDLLKVGIPSNIIIGAVSLVFDEATYIIRNHYTSHNANITVNEEDSKKFKIILNYEITKESIVFDDNNINQILKNRINEWIDDMINVISFDPSTIMTKKFFKLLHEKENKENILNYIAGVFTLFLYNLNIIISKDKAFLYSEFILDEVIKKLKSINLEEIDL